MNLVYSRPVARRYCQHCGILFEPLRAHHFLYRRCYSWSLALDHISEAARLIREAEGR